MSSANGEVQERADRRKMSVDLFDINKGLKKMHKVSWGEMERRGLAAAVEEL